jgi:hypothetical protein
MGRAILLFGAALGAACTIPAAHARVGPFVKGPYLQDLRAQAVAIRVEVDPPGPVSVDVEPAGAAADAAAPSRDASATRRSAEDRDAVAFHTIRVSDLTPSTRYRYTVHAGSASQSGTFTTAPPDDSTAPFSFLVYGDNRTNADPHAAVVRAMLAAPGDFIVNTGDYVSSGANAEDWQTFFDIEGPLLRDRALFGSIGNHELVELSGASYRRYFGSTDPAESNTFFRTFRWGPARFFVLNSGRNLPAGTNHVWTESGERDWLKGALEKSDHEPGVAWRFAVIHHGPFSAGPHGDNVDMFQAHAVDLLAEHQIDLVFAGHDHLYERGDGRGVRYIVSGGGGADLYDPKAREPSTRRLEKAFHYVEVAVTQDDVKIAAKRADGSLIEKCGLLHGKAGWDCDPPTPPAAGAGAAPATSTSSAETLSTTNASASRCGCAVTGATHRTSASFPLLICACAGLAFARRFRYARTQCDAARKGA